MSALFIWYLFGTISCNAAAISHLAVRSMLSRKTRDGLHLLSQPYARFDLYPLVFLFKFHRIAISRGLVNRRPPLSAPCAGHAWDFSLRAHSMNRNETNSSRGLEFVRRAAYYAIVGTSAHRLNTTRDARRARYTDPLCSGLHIVYVIQRNTVEMW